MLKSIRKVRDDVRSVLATHTDTEADVINTSVKAVERMRKAAQAFITGSQGTVSVLLLPPPANPVSSMCPQRTLCGRYRKMHVLPSSMHRD